MENQFRKYLTTATFMFISVMEEVYWNVFLFELIATQPHSFGNTVKTDLISKN